ncbi:MAG TPA: MogA/MoaB family molybdenum cofactor biosynthesis protein [Actinomycetota bacterium]|nr:MogA/MoaB family molybdenum cofactor biosynthesis protein [Actinomycetota bacterium]
MKVAVLTISDRSARGERADEGGPLVEQLVVAAGGEVVTRAIVSDERSEIETALKRWSDDDAVEVVITTGGTGLGARDVTPEATKAVIDKEAPGIAELMRSAGTQHTPMAALSRQVAGTRGNTLIVNLPGSPKAIEECLDAIIGILPHAVEMLRS